jgi:tRNA-specific adenosine deaminase 3
MRDQSFEVKVSEEMGRGLYARRIILKDEVVEIAEILLLNEADTIKVNDTELKYYTFKYDSNRDCLVLGSGEIFNHADMPNVSYSLKEIDGRFKMVFTATKAIFMGEQLFIDYKADAHVNVRAYIKNSSLVG